MAIAKTRGIGRGKSVKRGKRHLGVSQETEKIVRTKSVMFEVWTDKIRSKPRFTQRDKWKSSSRRDNWLAWKDLVSLSYRVAKGVTFFQPVAVRYSFYLSNQRVIDMDNLMKGINDALNGLAWPDDRVKYVRKCDGIDVDFVKKGEQEGAKIRIRPLNENT